MLAKLDDCITYISSHVSHGISVCFKEILTSLLYHFLCSKVIISFCNILEEKL